MFKQCRSLIVFLLTAVLVGCGGPKNATVGIWAGASADQIPGAQPKRYKLAITDKDATLYDASGTAVGTFPVSFPNSNEAVLTGLLGMTIDVTAQPDGSVRVVGLNLSATPAGSSERSSDTFHRVWP